MLHSISQADILDKISRVGQAGFTAAVIQDLQTARTGHEINVVPPELRMWLTIAVEQRKGRRCSFDCTLNNLPGKQKAFAASIHFKTKIQHPFPHSGAPNLHAGFCHDAHCLVQNLHDHFFAENVKCWPHV